MPPGRPRGVEIFKQEKHIHIYPATHLLALYTARQSMRVLNIPLTDATEQAHNKSMWWTNDDSRGLKG